jgi:hypothetical protein
MGRSRKTRIAASTAAAVGDHQALIGTGKVVDLLSRFLVVDDRSYGNLEDDVAAFAAGLVGALAVTPALGLVFRIEAEMNQGIMALAGLHDDVAALAAIASRRATARNKFLAAKGETAVAAIASLHPNFRFVNEHGLHCRASLGRPDEDVWAYAGFDRRGRLGLRGLISTKKPRPGGEARSRVLKIHRAAISLI